MEWQAIEALGTVGAVVVAVLSGVIRAMWGWARRPRLDLDFQDRDPWKRHAMVGEDPQRREPFWYFRVSVHNAGHAPAEGVTGWASSFTSAGVRRDDFDEVPLHWVGTGYGQPTGITILPGQTAYLDVFRFRARGLAGGAEIELVLQDPTPRGTEVTAPFVSDVAVTVAVAAKNVPCRELGLSVHGDVGSDVSKIAVAGHDIAPTGWTPEAFAESWQLHRKSLGVWSERRSGRD